jgi:histone H3
VQTSPSSFTVQYQPSVSTPASPNDAAQQPRRFQPGTVALAQIRASQQIPDLLINKLAFQRLLREIFQEIDPEMRIQSSAVQALQEATEAFMISFMEDANLVAIQDKMVTVLPEHMRRAMKIRATAAGRTIPDGPITSANLLRLMYGMDMKEDHDGDSGDEESDEGDGESSPAEGEDDEDDEDMESDGEETSTSSQSSMGAVAASDPQRFAAAGFASLVSTSLTVKIGDKLKEFLLKSRSTEYPPLDTSESSADESLPVMVTIEDLRVKLGIPDAIPLHLALQTVRFDPF